MMEEDIQIRSNQKSVLVIIVSVILTLVVTMIMTYAIFSFLGIETTNNINTGKVNLQFTEGENNLNLTNQFPISDIDAYNIVSTGEDVAVGDFSITGNITLAEGLSYQITAIKGNEILGKNRFPDNQVKLYLVGTTNGNGTISIQNGFNTANAGEETYGALASAGNSGTDTKNGGEILLATGQVFEDAAVHNYTLRMWLSDAIRISDTTTTAPYCASVSECVNDRPIYSTMYYSIKLKVISSK